MGKPKGCKYPDCFNCILSDCECNEITYYQANKDKVLEYSRQRYKIPEVKARKLERQRQYHQTEQYKDWRRNYELKRKELKNGKVT